MTVPIVFSASYQLHTTALKSGRYYQRTRTVIFVRAGGYRVAKKGGALVTQTLQMMEGVLSYRAKVSTMTEAEQGNHEQDRVFPDASNRPKNRLRIERRTEVLIPMNATPICPGCGVALAKGTLFCTYCGVARPLSFPVQRPAPYHATDSGPCHPAVKGLSQIFGIDPRIAFLAFVIDLMLFGSAAGTLGLTLPVVIPAAIASGVVLGFLTYKAQIKWFGDDHDSALIKAGILALLTAIPVGIPAIVWVPSGLLGLFHNMRKK